MAGFASITGQQDYVYADNASFDGTERGGGLTTNGQLWIGNTATGKPTVNTLTAGSGVSITNGNGSIEIGLSGAGTAIDSIGTQFGVNPVTPTAAGLVTINGATVAAGTSPVKSNGTGANTVALEVQISQALAATDATKIGLCNFDSTDFTVDANGFVEFSTTGAAKTITGDTGGALSPTANNWNIISNVAGNNAGSTVSFSGSGSTLTLDVTSAALNTIVGKSSGNATLSGASGNVGLGYQNLQGLTSGDNNHGIGTNCLQGCTTGGENIAIGFNALNDITTQSYNLAIGSECQSTSTGSENSCIGYVCGGAVTGNQNTAMGSNCFKGTKSGSNNAFYGVYSGGFQGGTCTQSTAMGSYALYAIADGTGNTACGYSALGNCRTGSYNIGIGHQAGNNLNTTDASNIIIGNAGTALDNNKIIIGTQGSGAGQQNTCFIAGIASVSVATPQVVTINTSTGQLGSTVGVVSSWVEETGATRALLVNQGVIGNRGTAQTFTLPDTAAQGSIIRITNVGAGLITIAQNAGESIRLGTSTTTVGVGGTLTATNTGDAIELVCTTANTSWFVLSVVGSWTVV